MEMKVALTMNNHGKTAVEYRQMGLTDREIKYLLYGRAISLADDLGIVQQAVKTMSYIVSVEGLEGYVRRLEG